MGSVNKVILVGNLGRDAEKRYTPSGAVVATIHDLLITKCISLTYYRIAQTAQKAGQPQGRKYRRPTRRMVRQHTCADDQQDNQHSHGCEYSGRGSFSMTMRIVTNQFDTRVDHEQQYPESAVDL